jgi:DNA-binding response OmpR family regulator
MATNPVRAARVLVVEDEMLVAMVLEDQLADAGREVVGPAFSLEHAMRLAASESLDGAALDINLAGEKVYPVADLLAARNVPFVYVTGLGQAGLREADQGRPMLQKPYLVASLEIRPRPTRGRRNV